MGIAREKLKGTDFRDVATGRRLAPVHPGHVLMKDFIEPMGITRYRVAKLAGVQQRRIDEICAGNRSMTGDTALRLARLFGTRMRRSGSSCKAIRSQNHLPRHAQGIEAEVTPLAQAA
ncbi:MAG: HigA family addiction module antidote protein [Betaproteobacteria bacterium]|nr:HigA family addiction module antidote protein [Betaproteobacteria bacterium]